MALVIIDMQQSFQPEVNEAKSGVLKLIHRAKAGREMIFIVTFLGCGRTIHPVLDAVKGYPFVSFVKKDDIDGSDQLFKAIEKAQKHGLIQKFSKMRFCGVYTSQCVRHTMLSLCDMALQVPAKTAVNRHTKMELILEACADEFNMLSFVKRAAERYSQLRIV